MNRPSRRLRLTASALFAVALAGAAAMRVAPLGPHLEVEVHLERFGEEYDLYRVHVRPRGGAVIPLVRVEPTSAGVHVVERDRIESLPPDLVGRFLLQADGEGLATARVIQEGEGARVYPVRLREPRP